MITKWYEIVCDGCGCAQHYRGSKNQASLQFCIEGGTIRNNLHFCQPSCLDKYKTKENKDK